MILTKQCACGQKVEFEAEDLPELTCPSCGQSLHAQFAPKVPLPPEFQARTEIPAFPAITPEPVEDDDEPNSTRDVLNQVRAQSCYKTLRGLIETVIAIALGIVVVGLIVAVFGMFMNQQTPQLFVAGAVVLGSLVICAILLIALKEALLLGIDAVDVLIADRANREAAALEAAEEKAVRRQLALKEFESPTGK